MLRRTLIGLTAAFALGAASTSALAQGTAITYQGQLKQAGSEVNSPTDMQFSLWTAPAGGSQVGSTVTTLAVPVSSGLFTTPVDFGVNPYVNSQNLYLQIAVRNPAGSGSYVAMGSRQLLTPTPFSLATRGVKVDDLGRVFLNPAGPGSQNDVSFTVDADNPGMLSSFNVSNGGFATRLETLIDATTAGNPGGARIRMQSPNVGYGPLTLNDAITIEAGPNGGRVGIGNSDPIAQLQVGANDVLAGGASTSPFFIINGGPLGGIIGDNVNLGTFGYRPDGGNQAGLSIRAIKSHPALGWLGTSLGLSMDVDQSPGEGGELWFYQGNVGIGTAAPALPLDIIGETRIVGGYPESNVPTLTLSGFEGALLRGDGWNVHMTETNYAIKRFGLDLPFLISATTGNVAIGTADSAYKLDVGGNIRCFTLTESSSRDLKEDIAPLSGGLDAIMKLNPVTYSWNDQASEQVRGRHDIGFLAEEMNEVLPDVVAKDENGKPVGINYGKIAPVAVEAIKQLKHENDQLKARLEMIEAILAAQAAK